MVWNDRLSILASKTQHGLLTSEEWNKKGVKPVIGFI